MLRDSVGIHKALDKQGQTNANTIQDTHGRWDQVITILKILLDLFLRVTRVSLDVTGDEEDKHERRQDPERPVQVRVLRILRLEAPIKWD